MYITEFDTGYFFGAKSCGGQKADDGKVTFPFAICSVFKQLPKLGFTKIFRQLRTGMKFLDGVNF